MRHETRSLLNEDVPSHGKAHESPEIDHIEITFGREFFEGYLLVERDGLRDLEPVDCLQADRVLCLQDNQYRDKTQRRVRLGKV